MSEDKVPLQMYLNLQSGRNSANCSFCIFLLLFPVRSKKVFYLPFPYQYCFSSHEVQSTRHVFEVDPHLQKRVKPCIENTGSCSIVTEAWYSIFMFSVQIMKVFRSFDGTDFAARQEKLFCPGFCFFYNFDVSDSSVVSMLAGRILAQSVR